MEVILAVLIVVLGFVVYVKTDKWHKLNKRVLIYPIEERNKIYSIASRRLRLDPGATAYSSLRDALRYYESFTDKSKVV